MMHGVQAKESVKAAYENHVSSGVRFERKAFQAAFGLADKQEGMRAFIEKRSPEWKHR
jgi:enoyl-CoA hydratase